MAEKHYVEISTKCHSDQSINVETGGRNYDFKGTLTITEWIFTKFTLVHLFFFKRATVINFTKIRQTL